jgi:hypothetical protein
MLEPVTESTRKFIHALCIKSETHAKTAAMDYLSNYDEGWEYTKKVAYAARDIEGGAAPVKEII